MFAGHTPWLESALAVAQWRASKCGFDSRRSDRPALAVARTPNGPDSRTGRGGGMVLAVTERGSDHSDIPGVPAGAFRPGVQGCARVVKVGRWRHGSPVTDATRKVIGALSIRVVSVRRFESSQPYVEPLNEDDAQEFGTCCCGCGTHVSSGGPCSSCRPKCPHNQ